MRIVNQEKGDSILFLKLSHELHLMLMYILKGKGIYGAFLSIETNRYSLHYSDIVHRTFLVKIGKRNVPAFFVYIDRRNGRRNFLNKRQTVFQIFFIRSVY